MVRLLSFKRYLPISLNLYQNEKEKNPDCRNISKLQTEKSEKVAHKCMTTYFPGLVQ
jgi:hypothetical protein